MDVGKIRKDYGIDISADEYGGPFELKLNLKSYEDIEEFDTIKLGMVSFRFFLLLFISRF